MDKASLLGDAIAHINHLQEKLHAAEMHIKELQSLESAKREEVPELLSAGARKDAFQLNPERSSTRPVFDLLSGSKKCNIAVDILGDEAMIRVTSPREAYSVVNMMLTLQELRLDVQHSNTSTANEAILHIIIAKVFGRSTCLSSSLSIVLMTPYRPSHYSDS